MSETESETETETERTELVDLANTRKAALAELTLNDTLTVETSSDTYDGRVEELRVVDATDYRVTIYADGDFHVLHADTSPVHGHTIVIHEEGNRRNKKRTHNVWVN